MSPVYLLSAYKTYALLAVAAAAVTLTGCRAGYSEPVGPGDMSALLVDVQVVEKASEYRIQREFIGRVEPTRRSEIGFELPGELSEVYVDEGDTVSAGQLLAQLDTARLEARLAEAQAALDQAVSAHDLAVRTHERRAEAAVSGGISRQAVDEALDAANAARAGVAAARARVNSVKVDLHKSRLVAPYAAVVVARQADEGNIVAAGNPVLHLQELAAPEVRIGVASEFATSIAAGDLYLVNIGSRQVEGSVRAVLPLQDPSTRTVDVILTLGDRDAAYPGDLARIAVQQPVVEPGYWLPVTALTEGSRGLWTANVVTPIEAGSIPTNGATHVVEPRTVEVLYKEGTSVFVRGSILPGDRIVISGTQRIVPYQKVRVADAVASSEMPDASYE